MIPSLARPLGEGNGKPLQYPCLENPMDRGTWDSNPWDHRVGHNGMTDTLRRVCSALHKLRKQLILYRIQHPRGLRSVTDFRYLGKEEMLEKRNAELLDNTSR